jgi:3-oxoacyl-[acyl-carrier-protein] synthase-3
LGSQITKINYYFPDKAVYNSDLAAEFELTEEDIYKRSGVKRRFVAGEGEIGSDLGVKAAELLLDKLSIEEKQQIDFILFCTEGLDYKAPTTACIIQNRLGLSTSMGAMDIPMGCTGFINGLMLAQSLIVSGNAKKVLFITAEIASTVTHPKDLELRALFSDAGAATLICASDINKVGQFVIGTNGAGYEHIIVRRSCTRNPPDLDWLKYNDDAGGMKLGQMEMNSKEIFLFAFKKVPQLIADVCHKNNISQDEVDLFIFHQANGPLLDALRRKIKIPEEKFYTNMENIGNTVSCSIPIALDMALNEGKIKPGDKVLIAGFGIGLSWGATILYF